MDAGLKEGKGGIAMGSGTASAGTGWLGVRCSTDFRGTHPSRRPPIHVIDHVSPSSIVFALLGFDVPSWTDPGRPLLASAAHVA